MRTLDYTLITCAIHNIQRLSLFPIKSQAYSIAYCYQVYWHDKRACSSHDLGYQVI